MPQIDALLTKIMDNEASRAYSWKHVETKNGIYQIDGYWKCQSAAKNKFQQHCEDLAETKFKINVYPWWNW